MMETTRSLAGDLAVLIAGAALSVCGAALAFVIRIHGRVSSLESRSALFEGWLDRVERKLDDALELRRS
jgi:hypothetical protein